jgi:methylmalonyl-CoA mutase N-terminal domain/subunit
MCTCSGGWTLRPRVKWEAALKQVEDTARGTGNLMPTIVEAVEANATVGEISVAIRRVLRRVPRDSGDLTIPLPTLSS